jgi:phosphoribosylglycinamide formyltransferase-1
MEKSQMDTPIRIGALISGGGTNLQAIIDACKSGKIDGTVVFVGSDNPDAGGLNRAKKHQIPCFVVDYASIIRRFKDDPESIALPQDFDLNDAVSMHPVFPAGTDPRTVETFLMTRAAAESRLLESMNSYPFDLLVLAGFMRKLSPYFIDRVNTEPGNPRIMNIHPALLPAFPGGDGYGDTFRYGCKLGGCTVHFIDYGEDTGPIIAQKAFEIQEDDTLDTIKKKGLSLEWEIYPRCINLFALGRLKTVRMSYRLKNGKQVHRTIVKIVESSPI